MTKKRLLHISSVLLCTIAAFIIGRSFPPADCYLALDVVSDGDYIVEYYLENRDKYCFSSYAPHGGYWYEMCHDTSAECETVLSEYKTNHFILYTDECYQPEITPAWCVGNIMLGYRRTDDVSDDEYDAVTWVCTLSRPQCEELRTYQHPEHPSECYAQMVLTRPAEMSHLTPGDKINEIYENNKTKGN